MTDEATQQVRRATRETMGSEQEEVRLSERQWSLLELMCRPKVEGQFSVILPVPCYGHSRRTAMALHRRGLVKLNRTKHHALPSAKGRAFVRAQRKVA